MATTNAYSKREVYRSDIIGRISIDIYVDYIIAYYTILYTLLSGWIKHPTLLYISSKTKPALQALY
jgi:hypothetical protein